MKAVIFDLDGVIADTVHLYYLANKRIADEVGVAFTKEWNQQLQGISRKETIEAFIRQSSQFYTEEEKVQLGEKKNAFYQESIQQLTPKDCLPGIRELLASLQKEGIKTAVASSSSNAQAVLHKLELSTLFDHVVDVKTIKYGKPHPEIFLTAAASLNVKPRDCVAIEDGEAGLQAIQQTDMFSIGVGAHEAMEHADWHVESTTELTLTHIQKKFAERGRE
ncbi:beta-phosphoglucomutase [Bacillus sp. CGMCC 1.16541]|uniref:beta-phosphoglucomutase n=1 Tax=Bacillus sp. CGMCC 1.16541 TaxID=2185143 RepID=UPI000D726914|nr:beta-phosphoglucomutase [Bacillus sp. CGMCC 1.16541]